MSKLKKDPSSMKSLGRAVKKVYEYYPVLSIVAVALIIFSAIITAIPTLFTQSILESVEKWYLTGDWNAAKGEILPNITLLAILYILALIASVVESQLMVTITQGFLNNMRMDMFDGMQDLPIRYFDTHKHGDIMSHYTNDIDTLRELVSQSIPTMIRASIIVIVAFCMMVYFSVWLTIIPLLGVIGMLYVAKVIGGGSSRYFLKMQNSLADTEGFIQEMMNGQKVIKVFNHEKAALEDFDRVNGQLFDDAWKAHAFANTMGPIFNNLGNILYVIIALVGGVLILSGVQNISISGLPLDITIVIPFLGLVKQFTGNCNQLSQQVNTIVMASAGATRVFALIDEEPEVDNGQITLVNMISEEDGSITEVAYKTGRWAWKIPSEDGTVSYQELKGDVRMNNVDFSYVPGKEVLHDISVYAEPGQKVAFVGATGAGKTTIANLINRFYDIDDGKIKYDGINVTDIKKSDLRRAVGVVLQETNLFTGTVMENIRYGNLNATDDECKAAAALAGADDFINRLPDGYDTMLTNNASNLSQGQRQLLSIARVAVADPPAMILDEATASIDTHTEALVQAGMDKLMEDRTVFVIAHRLSTVKDANVIMVLDHGSIIERGTHESLLEEKGVYYQLYTGVFELE